MVYNLADRTLLIVAELKKCPEIVSWLRYDKEIRGYHLVSSYPFRSNVHNFVGLPGSDHFLGE